jgi:sorting nexin-1/2
VVLPPLPERNLVASKIQTSTKFLESRRKALAVFLVRVVAHPSLRTADSLRAFLTQSDQEWAFTLARSNTKPTTATELLEKAGSMFGLLNHKAANLVQGKRDDAAEDPEYLRFRDFINILEAHTNELHKHAARLAQKTESSGSVLHRLRDATTGLAQFEKEPLVAALQHVSRACDTVGTQRTSEGQRLENGLACTLKEAVRGLREVKHTMEARSRTLTRVARAVGELEARQGRVARLRAVPGTTADKITLADRDVQVAEAEVASARSEYEGIVGGMGAELPRFQMERSEELRRALRAFVVGQKEAAEEQARTWTEALRVLDQPLGVEGSPT